MAPSGVPPSRAGSTTQMAQGEKDGSAQMEARQGQNGQILVQVTRGGRGETGFLVGSLACVFGKTAAGGRLTTPHMMLAWAPPKKKPPPGSCVVISNWGSEPMQRLRCDVMGFAVDPPAARPPGLSGWFVKSAPRACLWATLQSRSSGNPPPRAEARRPSARRGSTACSAGLTLAGRGMGGWMPCPLMPSAAHIMRDGLPLGLGGASA